MLFWVFGNSVTTTYGRTTLSYHTLEFLYCVVLFEWRSRVLPVPDLKAVFVEK